MEKRRSRFLLGPVMVLVCLLVQPVQVASQCMVVNTVAVTNGTTGGFVINEVMKTLNASFMCALMGSNATNCVPPGATLMDDMTFTASANTGTAGPFCNWTCTGTGGGTCAVVRIDSTDGLPVELMGFEISDAELNWEPADSGADAGDDPVESKK